MAPLPRVVVIFTGGTIAMLPHPDTGAAVPVLDGAGLLERLPGLGELALLESVDWGLVPASHLRFGQILEIGDLIAAHSARPEVAGVVVVQGTDVLEETALAWDLLHTGEAPIAVVGAMRNAADPDYDGPRNLRDAVRTVVHPGLRGQGVVVVMAGRILPADDATKVDSQALDAFRALDRGPLGSVEDGVVTLGRTRGARATLPRRPAAAAEPVMLLTAVVSTDGELVRAACERGAVGLVIEATGSGNTDPDVLAAAVEAMAAGIPVVLTSRCASGPVGPDYGFPGGGRSWQDAGAILAGSLRGPKARVALALGLGAGLDDAGLRRLLAVAGGVDPSPAAAEGPAGHG